MNKTNTTRRDFLKASAAAGTAAYFMSSPQAFANNAANDPPQIGCIGLGVRGINNSIEHAEYADIIAICDVDSRHVERSKHDEKIVRGKCDTYKDYRKILDRDDIDAVSDLGSARVDCGEVGGTDVGHGTPSLPGQRIWEGSKLFFTRSRSFMLEPNSSRTTGRRAIPVPW